MYYLYKYKDKIHIILCFKEKNHWSHLPDFLPTVLWGMITCQEVAFPTLAMAWSKMHMQRTTWKVHRVVKIQQSLDLKSYWAALSCGTVYTRCSNFWVCRWNPKVWPFKWKLLSSTFLWCCLYKVVLHFECVDEILKCDHSNESYWAVLSCGAVYCALQGGSNF